MRTGFLDISGNISVLEVGLGEEPDEPERKLRNVGRFAYAPGEQVIAEGQATITVMSGWSSRPGFAPLPSDFGYYVITDRRLCVVREMLVGDARLADNPASDAVRLLRANLKEKGDREYIEVPVAEMSGYLGGRLYIMSDAGYYQLWITPASDGEQLFSRIPGLKRAHVPLREDGTDFIQTKSHSQPGLFKYLVGAILCAVPVALSPLAASGSTNPEVCYAWSSIFWVGLAAFLVRWASVPRKLRIDAQGVKLISLLGGRFIPFSDIQLLSSVKRLKRVLAPGDKIEMDEYAGVSITRIGGTQKIVATDYGEALDIDLFYRSCAPADNLHRLDQAGAAHDAGAERADIQSEMDRFVRDLKRNSLLRYLGAAGIFSLTVIVVVFSLGDYNLRHEYISLQTKASIGVLIGAIVLAGYFVLFAYVYGMRLKNRQTALEWRINNFNSDLPMDETGAVQMDAMVLESAKSSAASIRRTGWAGMTILGGMVAALGVMGVVDNGGMDSARVLVAGLIGISLGIAELYLSR